MTRALCYGLEQLKSQGFRYVFVSTSSDHGAAIPLYERIGFVKSGEAHLYIKHK